ncbi:MAG: fructose-bisphosphate aldolase [Acidipropionibacterium acidipropionici]|jgi:class I fructose-bisphosphate aldolase|uniref:Fructose-bisphosphate aldolase n=1 Tax=Acidipropionibacterium acidipropionici (strain ATCC 4875 / DSM 20272 / JCM 6432 / NBRC 12425 / NCIMB 8070 / 4) TaxID=1171373 RepID=K7S0R2_ACIA4|nr:fructose-bisphosphate aldolase [Acidipropionibacterium acidipropionici]AFV90923.1 Fructose-bisphosphate aldolase [Acidipropionibacterium acidipropionici ATCC 4875]ALN14965.1 fructose-bisphosphate aldolase [Acidipropionibacterium acidipropionici]APZ09284.1 fructose-bisphosphate aldolase [Acidipropionibacterium acidipropionici]
MTDGVSIRLGRLFDAASNRSFIVAFDHGMSLPLDPALGNPVRLLERIAAGNPDGILLNKGMLAQAGHVFARRGAPVPVLRADWTPLDAAMKQEQGEAHRFVTTPAEALALGAGAVCTFLIGRPRAAGMYYDNVASLAGYIEGAHRAGLPVIVECTLWGLRNEDQKDPVLLAQVCRTAAELGADAVKTEYVGDRRAEEKIIACVGNIPVLTLGGAKGDDDAVARAAAEAIGSGARGLIFGRNVWQADDIDGRLETFSRITHSGRPSRRIESERGES